MQAQRLRRWGQRKALEKDGKGKWTISVNAEGTAVYHNNFLNTDMFTFPRELDLLGQLTALTVLDVRANKVTTLPPSIGMCTALVEIQASHCAISTLPPSLEHLTALRKLDVGHNRLRDLAELPASLVTLLCNDNQLARLTGGFHHHEALTALDLTRNALRELPASMGLMHALKEIHLAFNPLVDPPAAVVSQGVAQVLWHLREKGQRERKGPQPPSEVTYIGVTGEVTTTAAIVEQVRVWMLFDARSPN
jgi:hypothetical protein